MMMISKICPENSSLINIWQVQRVLYMETLEHLWYVSHFLECEMFQTEGVEKIKTHFNLKNTPPPLRRSCRLWDNMEKYSWTRQVTDNVILGRKDALTWWITTARIQTHIMQLLLLFHCNNGCTNAPQCYVYTYISCLVQGWIINTRQYAILQDSVITSPFSQQQRAR